MTLLDATVVAVTVDVYYWYIQYVLHCNSQKKIIDSFLTLFESHYCPPGLMAPPSF